MGSSGKKGTTMAKLLREGRLRDKRAEKQARKVARKLSAAQDGAEADSRLDEFGTASAEPEGDGPDGVGAESGPVTEDVAGRRP